MLVVGVCVRVFVEREGRSGFGLFHCPAPGWANFSNLQTVWTQTQGSEAKDPALRDSRLADSSHSWTRITSGKPNSPRHTFSRVGNLSRGVEGRRGEGGTKREGDNGTRRDERDERRKDLRSAILELSETEKTRQSDVTRNV